MKLALLALAALGALAVGAYGVFVEPYRLRVRRVRVPVDSFRASDTVVRILHLTDLHLRHDDARRVRMIRQLAGLPQPDLLLLTGDLVGGGPDPDAELATVLAALAPIQARYGAYAVLGNHDHVRRHRVKGWLGTPPRFCDTANLVRGLESHGIRVLTNAHATVAVRGQPLTLVGVDDPFYWLDDVRRAAAGAPQNTPRLLLAHTPDVVRGLRGERFALILCGHTHGGQIRLSERVVWHTNTRVRMPRNAGLMRLGRHRVYCSAGIGVSVLPVRLNCPPEAGWLELTAALPDSSF